MIKLFRGIVTVLIMASSPSFVNAAVVEIALEHCTKPAGDTTATHQCKDLEKKLVDIQARRLVASSLLTTNSKGNMFRHEISFGPHRVKIGAWKEDPLKSVTVLNISLYENGRGQVDYNEVSFFDDRADNYFSIALRPRSNTEFFRLKLSQSDDSPKPQTTELVRPGTF